MTTDDHMLRLAFHDHMCSNLDAVDIEGLATDCCHKIPFLVRVGAIHSKDVEHVTIPRSSDSMVVKVLDDVVRSHTGRYFDTGFHVFVCTYVPR